MQVADALEIQGHAALQIKDPQLKRQSLQTLVLVSFQCSRDCHLLSTKPFKNIQHDWHLKLCMLLVCTASLSLLSCRPTWRMNPSRHMLESCRLYMMVFWRILVHLRQFPKGVLSAMFYQARPALLASILVKDSPCKVCPYMCPYDHARNSVRKSS